MGFGAEIMRTKGGVQFQWASWEDAIGDPLIGTFTYALGSGRPVKVRATPEFDTAPLNDMPTAFALLSKPKYRGPVLALIGKDNFQTFS
jgi:hypothetical protein